MIQSIERRAFGVELRVAKQEGKPGTLQGHAAVFNTLSQDLGGFREKIAPGAFQGTLDRDVRALFNHEACLILGRTTSGTLRLKEDETGLMIENDLPDTTYARDLEESISRGDITQMSFGFRTIRDNWENIGGGAIRTLLEVELVDVSPVTYPAYVETDVAVRAMNAWQAQQAQPVPDLDLESRKLKLAAIS